MGIQKRESQREQPSQTTNQGRKDGTTTGWSPARTLTASSRSSGACSTRRRPRWRRTTPGWRSGSTLRVQAGGVEGVGAIRKTSRGRKARGEEGGRRRLHPEELLKELHPAQGGRS